MSHAWRGRRSSTKSRPFLESLEGRQMMTASLAPISDATLYQTMQLPVALDGGATGSQSYTVTSSNPNIGASVVKGRFATFTINHESSGPNDPAIVNGQMTFQLFDELTPLTIQRITDLIQQGFYDTKTIHRIASGFPDSNGFIVQGGSVNGDGTGEVPQPGFPFQDEFVPGLGFTGSGQLAMANAGRDTNSSQFFITTSQPRSLDYIHTIFGQLVSGFDVLQSLTKIPRDASDKPTPNAVNITDVTLSDTNPDGVILLNGLNANPGETSVITVTATDPSDNTTVTKTFNVGVQANTQNERPFFTQVPANITVGKNQTAIFGTKIFNAEPGDTISYIVQGSKSGDPGNPTFGAVQNGTATVDANGMVTLVPNKDFVGTINLIVGVRDQIDRYGTGNRNYDLQALTVTVTDGDPVNLAPIASDTRATTTVETSTKVILPANSGNVGQGLQYSIVAQPKNGTLTSLDDVNGTVIYTPNPGFIGTDTFQFQVRDQGAPTPNLNSEPATVTVTVTGETATVRLIPPVQPTDPEGTQRVLVVTPRPRPIRDRGRNTIQVDQDGDQLIVRVNGVQDQTTVNVDEISRIVIYGSKASDIIQVSPDVTVPATLNGGNGGVNQVKAGGGPTRLHGWFGRNQLYGGLSRDALIGRHGAAYFATTDAEDTYFLGSPNPGQPPKGQFFKSNGHKLVPVATPKPKFVGRRPAHEPKMDHHK